MSSIETRYEYKISRDGVYLGSLPSVKSDFSYSLAIKSAVAPLVITVATTADTSEESNANLETENGLVIETEANETITTEKMNDIIGNYSGVLIRNNNDVVVHEISDYYPNGKIVFSGYISRWSAVFGRDGEDIEITCLNYGTELDHYLIQGSTTLDQTNATSSGNLNIFDAVGGMIDSWFRLGQVFTPGAGVSNLAAIDLQLSAAVAGQSYTVTVKVFQNPNEFFSGLVLGSTSLTVTGTTPTIYKFTFPSAVTTNAGQPYFFSVQASNGTVFGGDGVNIRFNNSDNYAGGNMWSSSFGGGGGGSFGEVGPANDLYFRTYWTAGATNSPFNSYDPGQMVVDILISYISRGGHVSYDPNWVWATGTSQSYTFQVNTVLEGIKKALDLAPADWYWSIDPATNYIYFTQTSSVADHQFVLGNHIESLQLAATIEDVKTQYNFTGGLVGVTNLYIQRSSTTALAANNGRVGLERRTDNRVTVPGTAIAIVDSFLTENSSEAYESEVIVNANTYDLTLIRLGQTVGFAGFGTMVDSLILQIVGVIRTADNITLKLGKLPRRQSTQVEDIQRNLRDAQTVDNPAVPS